MSISHDGDTINVSIVRTPEKAMPTEVDKSPWRPSPRRDQENIHPDGEARDWRSLRKGVNEGGASTALKARNCRDSHTEVAICTEVHFSLYVDVDKVVLDMRPDMKINSRRYICVVDAILFFKTCAPSRSILPCTQLNSLNRFSTEKSRYYDRTNCEFSIRNFFISNHVILCWQLAHRLCFTRSKTTSVCMYARTAADCYLLLYCFIASLGILREDNGWVCSVCTLAASRNKRAHWHIRAEHWKGSLRTSTHIAVIPRRNISSSRSLQYCVFVVLIHLWIENRTAPHYHAKRVHEPNSARPRFRSRFWTPLSSSHLPVSGVNGMFRGAVVICSAEIDLTIYRNGILTRKLNDS
eukprot:IDg9883t1